MIDFVAIARSFARSFWDGTYLDEQLSLEKLPQRREIGLGLKAAGPWVLAQEHGDPAPRDLEHL